MTKNKFRAMCAAAGIECRYSGHSKTFYVSAFPPALGTHYRLFCPFAVEVDN